ncbi:hypothetical protein CNR27_09190 [Luteimonas chenhongjianii]|uniref:Uncharacterized protein n=1 Tax=Luteimonas chenhongjianii TaxID=2006110 RepID=A0A290XEN4_9GAMM|nr:hypothetical protein CNR27_09190 [Luteimonas chenhongjianii]
MFERRGARPRRRRYFLLLLYGFCAIAESPVDFDAVLEPLSFGAFEAAVTALGLVCSFFVAMVESRWAGPLPAS